MLKKNLALSLVLAALCCHPSSAVAQLAVGNGGVNPIVAACPASSTIVIHCKGSGAPTFSCTAGCLYYRTDGASGTTLYYCTGTTTWVSVPSPATIALTSGAGVPTASGSLGDIYRATDGKPGSLLYKYIGSYSNLPYIDNICIGTVSATGVFAVPCERNTVSGDLVVSFAAQASTTNFAAATGYSQICINGAQSPGVLAVQGQLGSGGSSTVSPMNMTGAQATVEIAVEIAHFNTASPIASSACSNVSLTPTTNDLILGFCGNNNGISNPGVYPSFIPLGFLDASNTSAMAWGIEVETPILPTGAARSVVAAQGTCGNGLVGVQVAASTASVTTNLWLPFG